MPDKKGFTLIEITVALVITGILTIIALPNYISMINQGAASAAQNNLITIYNAQKVYYINNTAYCTAACNTKANINTKLSLNVTDTNFGYSCAVNGAGYACTATNIANNTFTLTVKDAPTTVQIVLPGGQGCATNAGLLCNPSCAYAANPSYCPN
jgi:prepilin-type N-terminal cleavage/methylation domain-containing protein